VVVAVRKKMYEKDSLPEDMLNEDSSCASILSHGKMLRCSVDALVQLLSGRLPGCNLGG